MIKLALQANLWYNKALNIGVPERCWKHPQAWLHSLEECNMDSIPPHCVLFPLSNKDAWTIISFDDADLMEDRHWNLASGYVRCDYKHHEHSILHREIMERKLGRPLLPGMFVDHINGNPLDNRRCNLREVTPSQNQYNKRAQRQSASGYKGVIYDRRASLKKPWVARIRHDGKRIVIGYFTNPEDAARAYDEKAKVYHREYGRLNFPELHVGGGW